MKRIILIVILAIVSIGGALAQDSNGPEISFDKTVHKYGKIPYKVDGECVFTMTNTGSKPLILTNVQSSCGCAVPKWPRKPIRPGDTEEISVKYDTRRPGNFTKSIKVFCNAQDTPVVLKITGEVLKRK